MRLTINQTEFLIELFDRYKTKLYTHMRKNEYPIDKILEFINGYTAVTGNCYEYITDIIMGKGYMTSDKTNFLLFNSREEMIEELNKIVIKLDYVFRTSTQWEKIGIKYAICFATFYINDILFGNDMDVEDDLYMDIPDINYPQCYAWEDRGFDYNIYPMFKGV